MKTPIILASVLDSTGIDGSKFQSFLETYINVASDNLKITEGLLSVADVYDQKLQIQQAGIFLSLLRRSSLSNFNTL